MHLHASIFTKPCCLLNTAGRNNGQALPPLFRKSSNRVIVRFDNITSEREKHMDAHWIAQAARQDMSMIWLQARTACDIAMLADHLMSIGNTGFKPYFRWVTFAVCQPRC